MAIEPFEFSRSWRNAEDFPTTETDEEIVRDDMQSLHDEVRDYINDNLIPSIREELAGKATQADLDDAVIGVNPDIAAAASGLEAISGAEGSLSTQLQSILSGYQAAIKTLLGRLGVTVPGDTKAPALDALATGLDSRLRPENILGADTISLMGTATANDAIRYLAQYSHEHWWKVTDGGTVNYVHSTNSDLYPHNGPIEDDRSGSTSAAVYEYLGIPFQRSLSAAQIVLGSYVGNGTYGSSGKTTIHTEFVPKLVVVTSTAGMNLVEEGEAGYVVLVRGMTGFQGKTPRNTNGSAYTVEWLDDGVSFYITSYTGEYAESVPACQLNASGEIYHYVAIG